MDIHKKPLKWGETYLDRMSHEELLLVAKRMQSALHAAHSRISMDKQVDEMHASNTTFWNGTGLGGIVLEKIRQALNAIYPVDNDFLREQQYDTYYRYAVDLLFTSDNAQIGQGWLVCDGCFQMFAAKHTARHLTKCRFCAGDLRPLTWDDLAMKAAAKP